MKNTDTVSIAASTYKIARKLARAEGVNTQVWLKRLIRSKLEATTKNHRIMFPEVLPDSSTITQKIIVPKDRFELLEGVLTEAGVIDHDEWFCRGGARFMARGRGVWINPRSFNGAEWIVDIVTGPPELN